MARHEHQAQQIVVDLVDGAREGIVRRDRLGTPAEFFRLALEGDVAPDRVDRATFCSGHEPGSRIARNAFVRPLRERRDEGILCEVLGATDIAHQPRDRRDQFRRFDPPDRVDRAVDVRGGHAPSLVSISCR